MTTIWRWIKIGLRNLKTILNELGSRVKKMGKKRQNAKIEIMPQSNPESNTNTNNDLDTNPDTNPDNDRLNNILQYASEANQNSAKFRQRLSDSLATQRALAAPKRPGYPNTYPVLTNDPRIERPEVFDPALGHFFGKGFRLGEPVFQEGDLQERWLMARQQVMDHLLGIIHDSPWQNHLVLRGSLLLKAWLGDQAREPGDIDWVFHPTTIGVQHPIAQTFFQDLMERVSQAPQIGEVTIDVHRIAIDEIWTYERAPGRRFLFPWTAEGLPDGTLQMDITFEENLFIEPIQTAMPKRDGGSVSILTVTPALSLAWKLRWLEIDRYPQGKDLYDAVLLAESFHLPFDLSRQVLEGDPEWQNRKYWSSNFSWRSGFPWLMATEDIEWDLFQREYPWVEGTAIDWLTRLQIALAPTFAESEDSDLR